MTLLSLENPFVIPDEIGSRDRRIRDYDRVNGALMLLLEHQIRCVTMSHNFNHGIPRISQIESANERAAATLVLLVWKIRSSVVYHCLDFSCHFRSSIDCRLNAPTNARMAIEGPYGSGDKTHLTSASRAFDDNYILLFYRDNYKPLL